MGQLGRVYAGTHVHKHTFTGGLENRSVTNLRGKNNPKGPLELNQELKLTAPNSPLQTHRFKLTWNSRLRNENEQFCSFVLCTAHAWVN